MLRMVRESSHIRSVRVHHVDLKIPTIPVPGGSERYAPGQRCRYRRVRRPRSSGRYRRVRRSRSSGRYMRVRRHGGERWLDFGGCLDARGYASLDGGLGVDLRGGRCLDRGFCIDTLPARNEGSRYERPNTDDDANHEPRSPSCTLRSPFYHARRLDMSCVQPLQSTPIPLLPPARGFTKRLVERRHPAAAQTPTEPPTDEKPMRESAGALYASRYFLPRALTESSRDTSNGSIS